MENEIEYVRDITKNYKIYYITPDYNKPHVTNRTSNNINKTITELYNSVYYSYKHDITKLRIFLNSLRIVELVETEINVQDEIDLILEEEENYLEAKLAKERDSDIKRIRTLAQKHNIPISL